MDTPENNQAVSPVEVVETNVSVSPEAVQDANIFSPNAVAAAIANIKQVNGIIDLYITETLRPGVDYGTICIKKGCEEYRCKIKNHQSKPSMFKPGGEKLLQLFRLVAEWKIDEESRLMAGAPRGVYFFKCEFKDHSGRKQGEGRGACEETKFRGSNSAIKIAKKRAMIDCALTTFGLSDRFVQDIEDMTKDELNGRQTSVNPAQGAKTSKPPYRAAAPRPSPSYPVKGKPPVKTTANGNPKGDASPKQMALIHALINEMKLDVTKINTWCKTCGVDRISGLNKAGAKKLIDMLLKKKASGGTKPAAEKKPLNQAEGNPNGEVDYVPEPSGDNWSEEDTKLAHDMANEEINQKKKLDNQANTVAAAFDGEVVQEPLVVPEDEPVAPKSNTKAAQLMREGMQKARTPKKA